MARIYDFEEMPVQQLLEQMKPVEKQEVILPKGYLKWGYQRQGDYYKSDHAILKAAWGLIDTPDKWCQRFLAVDRHARPVDPGSVGAIRYCAVGAVAAVASGAIAVDSAVLCLNMTAKNLYGIGTIGVNDKLGWRGVKRVFEAAIERAA